MKKQLVLFIVFAIPLTLFSWYISEIRDFFSSLTILSAIPWQNFVWYIPLVAAWILPALAIAAYETTQSRQPARAALAVTVFWLVALTVYTTYWAAVVFLGYGGEQLVYLKIGASPDWLITDLQFYQHTMLEFLLSNGLLAVIVGPFFGASVGWLLMQSKFLESRPLEKILQ